MIRGDIMRLLFLLAILISLVGCAQVNITPVQPDVECSSLVALSDSMQFQSENWGLYKFVFNDAHTDCQVVPVHTSQFHLNALKFLEIAPCTNCVTRECLKFHKNFTTIGGWGA